MMNTDPSELEVVLLSDGSLEASFTIQRDREHLAARAELITEISRLTGRQRLELVSESSSRRGDGELVGSMKLMDLDFKPLTGTWLSREEIQSVWVDTVEGEEVRFVFADLAPRAAGSFEGFCDPCGGFRKHRLGCPLTRRSS